MPTFKKGYAERLVTATNEHARNTMRVPIRANYEALRATRIMPSPYPRYGFTNK